MLNNSKKFKKTKLSTTDTSYNKKETFDIVAIDSRRECENSLLTT
jgi:hypothetical protein